MAADDRAVRAILQLYVLWRGRGIGDHAGCWFSDLVDAVAHSRHPAIAIDRLAHGYSGSGCSRDGGIVAQGSLASNAASGADAAISGRGLCVCSLQSRRLLEHAAAAAWRLARYIAKSNRVWTRPRF